MRTFAAAIFFVTELSYSSGIVRELIKFNSVPFAFWQIGIERNDGIAIMMYTNGMFGGPMMWGMGLLWILVVVFLVAGIAAFIKYLRS